LCCGNDVGGMGGANGPLDCALSLFPVLVCTCIQVQILTKIMDNKVKKKSTAYGICT